MAATSRSHAAADGSGPLGTVPALDGLRGLAVASVVAYHFGIAHVPGGLLGVDVFFVLSGFLITTLLVDEWRATGSINLRAFWARRCRRLLPALVVLLFLVAGYSALFADPENRMALRADAAATAGYIANWHFAFSGQGYFDQLGPPSPLLHTWSLAVEEQFYLLWPLLVAVLLAVGRRRTVALVAALGAIASAAAMSALSILPAVDSSRLYYGTDTRAQALLVGAALAAVCPRPAPRGVQRSATGPGLALAGLVGAAVVLMAVLTVDGQSPLLYRGGFAVVAVVTAAVIGSAIMLPNSPLTRGLSLRPLRALGRVSYGVYLFHWPVELVLTRSRTGLSGPLLFGLRAGATLLAAELSFHLLELPVRRGRLPSRLRPALAATSIAACTCLLAVTTSATPAAVARGSEDRQAGSRLPPSAAPAARGASSALAPPIVRYPLGRPARVLLAGDSIAATIGWNLGPLLPSARVDLRVDAVLGCGIVFGRHIDRGRVIEDPGDCNTWEQRWRDDVAAMDPDVVAILLGRWEMTDRRYAGAWRHLGDPVFDGYVASQLDRAIAIGAARGARVVMVAPPCLQDAERPDGGSWPQDDPARLERFDELLRAAAAHHPALVRMMDLSAWVCPDGRFQRDIDGRDIRDPDGVHFTVAGARYVGRLLLPTLYEVARQRPPLTALSGRKRPPGS